MSKSTYNFTRKLSFCLILILLVVGGSACSSKKKGAGDGLGEDGAMSEEDLALKRWGQGNIPMADGGGPLEDVFFDYNSSALRSDAHETIKRNAQMLASDPSLHAELEGHCDRRGTNEYNLALGEERAKAIAQALLNQGVGASQLSTISYGEEIPLDPAENESAFAKNRRVHFAVYRKDQGKSTIR